MIDWREHLKRFISSDYKDFPAILRSVNLCHTPVLIPALRDILLEAFAREKMTTTLKNTGSEGKLLLFADKCMKRFTRMKIHVCGAHGEWSIYMGRRTL